MSRELGGTHGPDLHLGEASLWPVIMSVASQTPRDLPYLLDATKYPRAPFIVTVYSSTQAHFLRMRICFERSRQGKGFVQWNNGQIRESGSHCAMLSSLSYADTERGKTDLELEMPIDTVGELPGG